MWSGAFSNSPPTAATHHTLAQFTKLENVQLFQVQGSPTDPDLLLLAQTPQLKSLIIGFPEKSSNPEFPDAHDQQPTVVKIRTIRSASLREYKSHRLALWNVRFSHEERNAERTAAQASGIFCWKNNPEKATPLQPEE